MNSSDQHLQSLVAQLAQDGHQEISVVRLPSQVNRKQKTMFAPKNRKQLRAKVEA